MRISDILRPYADKNYQELFTSGQGFLVYRGGNWQIQKILPKNSNEYRKEIINALTRTKAWNDIPNETSFTSRLNNYEKSFSVAKVISFNSSKDEEYTFLSNFYPIVVEYKDHNNPLKTRSYPSSENAYQAHKAANALRLKKEKISNESVYICNDVADEDLEKLATLLPSESKKLANNLVLIKKTDVHANMKYNLMFDILRAKFTPGTKIAQKLVEINPAYLVEDTQDTFWGSKKTDLRSLAKYNNAPIKAGSSNVLGRILMEIRASLVT